jgi:hypothetical protein
MISPTLNPKQDPQHSGTDKVLSALKDYLQPKSVQKLTSNNLFDV